MMVSGAVLVGLLAVLQQVLSAAPDAVDAKDHCSVDTWAGADDAGLGFSKELSSKEYVVDGGGKSLHCCARGYRSIEWFKDGRPYPWPGDISNFILYPESANQTVYSKTTGPKDGGNYSCLARNDSHAFMHSVALNVIDAANYIGAPLPTYEVPDEQLIQLGATARLFCEAFVGSVDLPDAQSEIMWTRLGMNASFIEEQRRFTLRSVARENNQVLGAYLTIRAVKREDLGPYECRVTNAGNQAILLKLWLREAEPSDPLGYNPKLWRRLSWMAVATFILAVIATVFRHRLGILALFCRQRLAQPDVHDGKDYDVLVLHLEKDSAFANEIFNTLKDRYSYTCKLHGLQIADFDYVGDLKDAAKRCRRLLTVVRPSMIEALNGSVVLGGPAESSETALQRLDDVDRWNANVLGTLLQLLIQIHPQPVCITLQELPHGCEAREHSLANLLKIAPVIEWNQKRALWSQNWFLLRLRLPPLRNKQTTPAGSVAIVRKESGIGNVVTTVVSNCSTSSSKRRSAPYLEQAMNDSLEILV